MLKGEQTRQLVATRILAKAESLDTTFNHMVDLFVSHVNHILMD